MKQNGRSAAAPANADPRGGARAGGSSSTADPPAPVLPGAPDFRANVSQQLSSSSSLSTLPLAPPAAGRSVSSSSAELLQAGGAHDLWSSSPPNLSRANSSPAEGSHHSARGSTDDDAHEPTGQQQQQQPMPRLSNPGSADLQQQQQASYQEQMIRQHTLPSPSYEQAADEQVGFDADEGAALSSSAPDYGSAIYSQRPSISHSDMTESTPRLTTANAPRFETTTLNDEQQSQHEGGGDAPTFVPMPGFPAVGDLGGYPTGDGASKERAISSPGAPGLTIGMGSAGRESGEKRTLWLGDLEGWMDEAYLRQMCSLMGWDIVAIKLVRQPPPSHASPTALAANPTSNNYAFITFPTAHLASRILHTLTPSAVNPPIFMPNSARPFKANWASSSTTSSNPNAVNPAMASEGPIEREFSLFVGDLAPEVTEGDLVRLFLNPPPTAGAGPRKSFTSVRSAKIMLDPKGGGSRGYGFVRFAEEADQQRALSEMQGVYCLSRPMRLSHATAKNRSGLNLGGSQGGSSVGASSRGGTPTPHHGPGSGAYDGGRSSPYGGPSSGTSEASHLTDGVIRGGGYPARSSPSPGSVDQPAGQQQQPSGILPPERRLSPSTIEYLTQLAAANGGTLPFGPGMSLSRFLGDGNRGPPPPPQQYQQPPQQPQQQQGLRHAPSMSSLHAPPGGSNGGLHDPSAYHQKQQRPGPHDSVSPGSNPFPLGGPSEQYPGTVSHPHVNTALSSQTRPEVSPLSPLGAGGGGSGQGYDPAPGIPGGVNSTDPNNTTVFVGGLSSLISEETLKTFFAPFGEITYAKIPPGKGCGFVQFVRKQDAERAIERMQGFPIGGGRIRLSWGRSQYKAAQAAAQAAQLGLGLGALGGINGLNPVQISQLGIALQNLGGMSAGGTPLGAAGMSRGGPGGMYGRPGQGGPGVAPMTGLAAYGGFGPGANGMNGMPPPLTPGSLGSFNLGALSNLNPQALQSLIALASNGGLGGSGIGEMNSLGAQGLNGGMLPPMSQKELGGYDGMPDVSPSTRERAPTYSNGSPPSFGTQNNGGSSFTPFSPALSPVGRNSEIAGDRRLPSGLDARRFTYAAPSGSFNDDLARADPFPAQPHSAGSDEQFLSSTYSSSRVGSSPVMSERAVGGGFSQSHTSNSSFRNNVSLSGPSGGGLPMSPFDPDYRPTIPPLHTGSSMSSDASSRFFGGGAFSPPLTAPGVVNADYLQQQQQFAAPRARAASASVHSGGTLHDLAADLDGVDLSGGGGGGKGIGQGRLGGGVGTGPGSGRSFGYGSFGGNVLRSQLPPASRFQAERGGRFDEDE